MDSRKLSAEASVHAAYNERLPIRAVIQVIFSKHNKLSQYLDWSGSFNGSRNPNATLEQPLRCVSKREATAQQAEIRKLREDIDRLQMEKKKGFFRWKKLGLMPSFRNLGGVVIDKVEEGEGRPETEAGLGRFTPVDMKTRLVKGRSGRTPPKWKKSMS
ncbi:hypothetical protein CRG98_036276 [Punica granatum]|uniref:NPH3 domain-containing protein n=1 Tax=Punica granatum TaxID=22663 RepID=A0A2I0IIZ0_PUNGR|nr:hypothetical protein CRG98_036276 [Punica granatum]